jgi:hypothetical protein
MQTGGIVRRIERSVWSRHKTRVTSDESGRKFEKLIGVIRKIYREERKPFRDENEFTTEDTKASIGTLPRTALSGGFAFFGGCALLGIDHRV